VNKNGIRKATNGGSFAAFLIGLFAVNPSQALAYIDPGTSAMLVQLLIGGAAGLAVIAKLYWSRLKSFVGLGAKSEPKGTDTRTEDGSQSRDEE
jgi:hypothetical protein